MIGEYHEGGARNDVRGMAAVRDREQCVRLAVKNPRRRSNHGGIERPRSPLHGNVLSESPRNPGETPRRWW